MASWRFVPTVDKTKQGPLPKQPEPSKLKGAQKSKGQQSADPTFMRGTVDPTIKKGR